MEILRKNINSVIYKIDDRIKKSSLNENENYKILNEFNILSKIKHKQIIKPISIEKDKDNISINYKFYKNGNIETYLKNNNVTSEKLLDLAYKIIDIVDFLHSNNILHLDLKLDNFMLDEDFNPVIIDFGMSIENKNINIINKKEGNPFLIPIENIIQYKQNEDITVNFKTDIYQLGLLLYHLFNNLYLGEEILSKYNEEELSNIDFLIQKIIEKKAFNNFENIPNKFKKVILNCLSTVDTRYDNLKLLKKDLK